MFGLTRSPPAMNTRSQQTRRSLVHSTSAANVVAEQDIPAEEAPADPSSTNHDHSYGRVATSNDSRDYYIPPSGIPATMPRGASGSASGSATSGSQLDASSRSERVSSRHSGRSRASTAVRSASSAGSHSSRTSSGSRRHASPASIRSRAASAIDKFGSLVASTTIGSDAEDVTLEGSLAANVTLSSRGSSRASSRVSSRGSSRVSSQAASQVFSIRSSVRSDGRPRSADVSFQRLSGYLGLDPMADREAVFAHVRQLVQANQARVPTPVPAPVPAMAPAPYVAARVEEVTAVARVPLLTPEPVVDTPIAQPLDAIFAPPGTRLINRAKPVVPTFDRVPSVAAYDFIEELQEYAAISGYTEAEFMRVVLLTTLKGNAKEWWQAIYFAHWQACKVAFLQAYLPLKYAKVMCTEMDLRFQDTHEPIAHFAHITRRKLPN